MFDPRNIAAIASTVYGGLPDKARGALEGAASRFVYFGFAHFCPCCGAHVREFKPHYFARSRVLEYVCPICRALPRHRLAHLYIKQMTDLFDGSRKRVLHIAPETDQICRRLKQSKEIEYISADLFRTSVMLRMDVSEIPFRDETFDTIYCSHVLNCVPDDRKAIRELRRILKTDGWAILPVPIHDSTTTTEVTDPSERTKLFGRDDVLRAYGSDYEHRLTEAGFEVDRLGPDIDQRTTRRLGLKRHPNSVVHICRKASTRIRHTAVEG